MLSLTMSAHIDNRFAWAIWDTLWKVPQGTNQLLNCSLDALSVVPGCPRQASGVGFGILHLTSAKYRVYVSGMVVQCAQRWVR